MRIVILYNSSWYVFLLRQNLIHSLLAAGHTVTVVAPVDQYTSRVQQLGVDFVPLSIDASGTSPVTEMVTLVNLYRALHAIQPDVVLSFTVKCNLYAGLCRRRLKFTHVANVSGLGQLFDGPAYMNHGVHMLYRFSLSKTTMVFFQNPEDRARFLEHGVIDPCRSAVIPGSGVDLSRFVPDKTSTRSQRAFLIFGRLLPKKGFDHFIDAAHELRERYGDRVVFWILGAVDSSREESIQLLERIEQAHAKGFIRYLQATDDPLPVIREADVIVLPSTYNEGIPRSLLEALACGKPVVTTDWKGCRETVEPGKNGLLVRPDDTQALVEALDELACCEATILQKFGEHSRLLAERRFDEQIVLDAYMSAITRRQKARYPRLETSRASNIGAA